MDKDVFETFTPELQRLISLVQGNLHYIARVEMNAAQATALREMMSLPVGVLATRFGFQSRRDRSQHSHNLTRTIEKLCG